MWSHFRLSIVPGFLRDNANNSNTATWRHQNYETLSTLDTNALPVGWNTNERRCLLPHADI